MNVALESVSAVCGENCGLLWSSMVVVVFLALLLTCVGLYFSLLEGALWEERVTLTELPVLLSSEIVWYLMGQEIRLIYLLNRHV